ncbi:MAG: hypothetical protein ACK5OB_06285 [Pirellula sp.]
MKRTLRLGLTMLEVIFSMVVILVGMVAVATLIPLAGRQAEDSVKITQALAAGESALAVFNSTRILQPTLESPWCLIDDAANNEFSVASIRAAYDRVSETFPIPQDSLQAAIAQNEAMGIGFCIDPLFWGFQSRVSGSRLTAPFERTYFPFLPMGTSPLTFQPGARVPRLLRGSLTDPSAAFPGSWLRQPAATSLATSFGGDLIQPATRNKAIGPLRSMRFSGDPGSPLISSPTAAQQVSWLMTVIPSDNTPIIPTSRTIENWDGVGNNPGTLNANHPVITPTSFDVALVVFAKRDVREVFSIIPNPAPNGVPTNLPTNERIFRVNSISGDAINSGSFTVAITTHPNTDSTVRPGDWIMLSRFARRTLLPRTVNNSTTINRQVHRWYRVIGVANTGTSIAVRLYGKPWSWTEGEIADLQAAGANLPSNPPSPNTFETHAVLLKDVIHVYERQIELQ